MTANIPEDIKEFLKTFGEDDVRVIGSALFPNGGVSPADIDIAAEDGSPALARLIHLANQFSKPIHPISVPAGCLADLHDLMTWRNCCIAMTPSGTILTGKHRFYKKTLMFNLKSIACFNDATVILQSAIKLEKRGCQMLYSEMHQAFVALNWPKNEASLLSQLYSTIDSAVIDEIWKLGGVIAGGFFRDCLRSNVQPKDIDIFVIKSGDWNAVCDYLGKILEEIRIEATGGVNIRRFKTVAGLFVDVVHYPFVEKPEHVVETFDFSINQLWYNGDTRRIEGAAGVPPETLTYHILHKILKVAKNPWVRASRVRTVNRWARFRGEGFVPSAAETDKFRRVIAMLR